jgi:hypothetical protein
MKKVKLSATAGRTSTAGQFKGMITFKNEINKEVSFEYLCNNPENERLDLKFSNKNEEFSVKGLPSRELFESLAENQKCVLALSVEPIINAIQQSKTLSSDTTQMLRCYGGNVSGVAEMSADINEKMYSLLFSE